MRRSMIALIASLALLGTQPALAAQPERGVVRTLVDLSGGPCRNPEGIAASPNGLLYTSGLNGNVCVVTLDGRVTRVIPVAPGNALLGNLFVAGQGLYVADAGNFGGNGRVLRVDPRSGAVTVLATGFGAPNAITQDHRGLLYVSDSFAGAIYTVDPNGGGKSLWKADPLLLPHGLPPFGANGVAFDRKERFLYVANTADDRILRIAVNKDGSAGAVTVFADGAVIDATTGTTRALDGADGIQFDVRGNLYVAANQVNEIHVLSPDGTLIARYAGTGADAMEFPASPVFHGRSLYIANLAFSTPGRGKISVLGVPFPGAPIGH